MEQLRRPEAVVLEWACDLLVKIAEEHLMSRRTSVRPLAPDRCGICATPWPCRTYRLATGDPGETT